MWLLEHYWWILALVVAVPFAITTWRTMPRARVVLLLRIAGAAMVIAPGVWFFTGDIDRPGTKLHFASAWQAILYGLVGVAGLVGAHYLAKRARPSA